MKMMKKNARRNANKVVGEAPTIYMVVGEDLSLHNSNQAIPLLHESIRLNHHQCQCGQQS